MLDSTIHWINHYPVDKYYFGKPLSTGQRFIWWISLSTFWTTGAWTGQEDQELRSISPTILPLFYSIFFAQGGGGGEGYFLLKSTNSLRKQPTNISWHHHWFPCEMTSEKQVQKFHTSWPGPGGDSDWLNLLPIRRTIWSGKWHVISIEFLCSFLRRHFAGKPVVASEIFVSCFLRLPGHQ